MADLCPVAVGGGNEGVENQPETAGESYLQALKDMKLCDVVFTFENCDDRIEAHQLFLRLRSPVFFAMFRGQCANVGKTREVKVTGVTPLRFQEFLEFMYADKFEVNIAGALDLLHLGHKYKVNPLIKKCEQLLKTEIQVEDSVQLFETAKKYHHGDLEAQAGDIMAKNLEALSQNDDFLDVQEDTLVYLLERDDLTVEEVDLFKIVVKWGKNKLTDESDPNDLKKLLANVLPLLRFTELTPNEFASEVIPLNLLSPQEIISIYAYFSSDETNRQKASDALQFSTTPRNTGRVEELVHFYQEGTGALSSNGGTPLKECICFSSSYEALLGPPKPWDNFSSRRPAVTGILIHWPTRVVTRSDITDDKLNFKLSVKWSAGTISDQSVFQKFQKVFTDCTAEDVTEIAVEPPVELTNGATYCITLEDQCSHSPKEEWNSYRGYYSETLNFLYSQNTARSSTIRQTVSVPLKRFPLELNSVQRDISLSEFATNYYPSVRLVQGIRVKLM